MKPDPIKSQSATNMTNHHYLNIALQRACLALLITLNLTLLPPARAVDGQWTNTASSGGALQMFQPTNWLNGLVPGSTVGGGDTAAITNTTFGGFSATLTITNGGPFVNGMILGSLAMGNSADKALTIAQQSSPNYPGYLVWNNSGNGATLNFWTPNGTAADTISCTNYLKDNLTISENTLSNTVNAISGQIIESGGSYGITNLGPGQVYLSVSGKTNMFSRGLTIKGGQVKGTPANSFGSGPVSVYSGGTLYVNGGSGNYTNATSIAGNGFTNGAPGYWGALYLASTVNVMGPTTLTGDAEIGLSSTGSGIYGDIGGAHSLKVGQFNTNSSSGVGLILNNSANACTDLTVVGGYLWAINNSTCMGSGTVTLADNGIFGQTSYIEVGGGLSYANNFTLNCYANNIARGQIYAVTNVTGYMATIAGTVTIQQARTTNVNSGGHFASNFAQATNINPMLLISGPINSSPATISPVIEGGFVALSGGGTYNNLQLAQDWLIVGADNGLNPTATLTMCVSNYNSLSATSLRPSVLDLNGYNQTLAGITMATWVFTNTSSTNFSRSTVTNSSASIKTLTLNVTGTDTFAGQMRGNLNLAIGSGTVYLNGTNDFTGTCTVANGATLGGSGSVSAAVTVNNGGTLAPGNAGIGTNTFSGIVTLGTTSTNIIEVNRSGFAADKMAGVATFNRNGILSVVNLGASLQAGDTFSIFSATTYAGAFASISPSHPNADAALSWDTMALDSGNLTVNASPFPGAMTLGCGQNQSCAMPEAKLITVGSQANGYSLSVSAVSPASVNGGTVSRASGSITYAPAANFTGTDSFTYTLTDSHGGYATGTVTVNVSPDGESQNRLSPPDIIGPGTVALSYLGIPGYRYALDWSTNLTAPINWMPVITNTADTHGSMKFTNTSSEPNNYFRTRYVP